MRLRALVAIPLCLAGILLAGCSSSKPANGRYSNAFAPRDVKTVDAELAPIVAGKANKVYHARHCRYAAALNNPVGFSSPRDAEAKGLIPCEFCNPQLNSASVAPAR